MKKILLHAILILLLSMTTAAAVRQPPQTVSADAAVSSPKRFSAETTDSFTIFREQSGTTETMSVEDYCVRAVLSQIPPSGLSFEALKAQTVAARTYAVRKKLASADGYDITDDPSLYQTILDASAAEHIFGTEYERILAETERAAAETEGLILIYGSEPINAAFHLANAGVTEAASYASGESIPYLSAADSPGDVLSSYINVPYEFTRAEFSARLAAEYPETNFSTDRSPLAEITKTAPSGTVLTVNCGGTVLSGADISRIFTLPSAMFTVSETDSTVILTVSGSGHGMGMSITGADYMAANGADFEDILRHYYSGAELAEVVFIADPSRQ